MNQRRNATRVFAKAKSSLQISNNRSFIRSGWEEGEVYICIYIYIYRYVSRVYLHMHVHADMQSPRPSRWFGLSNAGRNARHGLTFFHSSWNLLPAGSSLPLSGIFSRQSGVTFSNELFHGRAWNRRSRYGVSVPYQNSKNGIFRPRCCSIPLRILTSSMLTTLS